VCFYLNRQMPTNTIEYRLIHASGRFNGVKKKTIRCPMVDLLKTEIVCFSVTAFYRLHMAKNVREY